MKTTIGVLTDWAESPYHVSILAGINSRTKEMGVNLLSFIGGAWRAPQYFESERNVVYDFVNKEHINGLIILSASIGHFCSREELEAFCNSYAPLPLVSIAQKMKGIHSLIIDNQSGVKSLVRHFVEVHKYKRIAFIGGPEGKEESELRKQAFLSELRSLGIEPDPRLIYPGAFIYQSGINGVEEFLDKRKVSFDAIIAANDNMALGALHALTNRGFRVPEDFGLAGFDDQAESKYVNPPLTTVAQPLFQQGQLAVENLLKLIAGEELPEIQVLNSVTVIRQSCGCPGESVIYSKEAAIERFEVEESWSITEKKFKTTMMDFARLQGLNPSHIETFIAYFKEAFRTRDLNKFKESISGLLLQIGDNSEIEQFWNKSVYYLSELFGSYLKNSEDIIFSKELCFEAQKNIAQHLMKSYRDIHIQLEQAHQTIHYTSGVAITINSTEGLLKILSDTLSKLDIINFFFCFYQKLDKENPEKTISRLSLAFQDGRPMDLPKRGIIYPAKKLLPENIFPQNKRFSFVVEPLFFENKHFGLAIFDLNVDRNAIFSIMFRWFLSSIIIVTLFIIHTKQQKDDLEAEVTSRTWELKAANQKLADAIETLTSAQTSLLQQAKMASLGRLTSGIAHELKNPLNFIINFSKINKEDLASIADIVMKYVPEFSEEDRETFLEIMKDLKDNTEEVFHHSKYADNIIKGMLNQARGETKQLENCNVNSLLKESLTLAYHSHKVRNPNFKLSIVEELDKNIPHFTANSTDLNKVFINMIDNALYAMEKRHESDSSFKAVLKIKSAWAKPYIFIQFIDNGTGIKEDVMNHIYDPFFTTKPAGEGTGIGLKTCYEIIVEGIGGELLCESEENKGTTFTIRLKS